jgi:hypothetical protein
MKILKRRDGYLLEIHEIDMRSTIIVDIKTISQ